MFRNPTTDLIVVLVVVLLIFGPKRLPGIGRGLGEGMREFKDSITGGSKDSESEDDDRPALNAAPAAPPAPTPTEAVVAPAPAASAPAAAPAPEQDAAEVGASERRS